jgi:hypothetical protein
MPGGGTGPVPASGNGAFKRPGFLRPGGVTSPYKKD